MSVPSQELCIAALGGMTVTLKAISILKNAGISAQVVALSPGEARGGCAYGASFPCHELAAVRGTLRSAHIHASEYLQRGGRS